LAAVRPRLRRSFRLVASRSAFRYVALPTIALSFLLGATASATRDKSAPTERARHAAPREKKAATTEKAAAPSAKTVTAREKPISTYGPISVGNPDSGLLLNARRMPKDKAWVLNAPAQAYGTEETVRELSLCLHHVHASAGGPPVRVGALSAKGGGKLAPHDSHRTGRDADVYFFRQPGAKWFDDAREDDLDLPRTWALLRCFVTDTDVDFVLIDQNVQGWLEAYAKRSGEPSDWVESLFHDDPRHHERALVRHAPGHGAHMHVRFVSPEARERGRSLYDRLVREGYVKGPRATLEYRVARGDTLEDVASRYQLSVDALKKLNGLKTNKLHPGQRLVVRRAVEVRGARDEVHVPVRRLPPSE
jgi:hypothetical protein